MAHDAKASKNHGDEEFISTALAGLQEDFYKPDSHQPSIDQSADQTKNSRSLFVRSLPPTTSSEQLAEFFSQSYPIKHAVVVADPQTKESRRYGFVTFADIEDASKAKDELNGFVLSGHKIKVTIAEPRHREVQHNTATGSLKSRPIVSNRDANANSLKQVQETQLPPKLIVRNLPWSIKTPDDLALLFRSYGKVKHAILPKQKKGLLSGFGFVVLRGRKNAEKAIAAVNGKVVDGRTLAVDWAVAKTEWQEMQTHPPSSVAFQRSDGASMSDAIKRAVVDTSEASFQKLQNDVSNNCEEDVRVENSAEEHSTDSASITTSLDASGDEDLDHKPQEDYTCTLFIRNLPFTTTDSILSEHFQSFGPLRYARVVEDLETGRPKGTGFVCFQSSDDALRCLKNSPIASRAEPASKSSRDVKHSVLEDTQADPLGRFSIDGRVLRVSRAVGREEAHQLAVQARDTRENTDRDKRRLFLLTEGNISPQSPLYASLSPAEIKVRQESAKQRQTLVRSNPMLHMSLTRLSVRNIPRFFTSRDLKSLAREAVVGFAKDVKAGRRQPLSREELSRGGEIMKNLEKDRKAKGQGIVKQAHIIFEDKDGTKVAEKLGAGKSRGYGFIEYHSHRCALMGLRWLNGHQIKSEVDLGDEQDLPQQSHRKGARLIVEFAIENAQVVARRHGRELTESRRSGKWQEGEREENGSENPTSAHNPQKKRKRGAGVEEMSGERGYVKRASLVGKEDTNKHHAPKKAWKRSRRNTNP